MLIINNHACLRCGGCISFCRGDAIRLYPSGIECDNDLCTMCNACVRFCPVDALGLSFV